MINGLSRADILKALNEELLVTVIDDGGTLLIDDRVSMFQLPRFIELLSEFYVAQRIEDGERQSRGNLDAATRRWAQLVYGANVAAGPRERDFMLAMVEVNNFRHACGLPMFVEDDLRPV